MTLGRIALARIPATRGTIHRLFSTTLSSSSTNRTSPPLSRHMSMKSDNLVSKLTSSGLLKTQGLIDGKWVDAHDGDTIKVLNPATGEVIANVPCMGQSETNDAISSAYDAFRCKKLHTEPTVQFSKMYYCIYAIHINKVSIHAFRRYDLLISHKEELGQLITLEQGKPLKEAMGEVIYGASFIEFYAEEAKRVYGDIIPSTLGDRRLFVLKQCCLFLCNPFIQQSHEFLQPVGVVGAITPWNFPLAMITRKVGPALACGCTVIVKPSELTPLTALAAAELALQAGIPPGVLNVVMGKASDIGDALLASPEVRKITFTGSTAVGKKLMAGAAGTVKRLSLELGGNAPCIVFDDADLDVAVKGSLAAKFRNSGQTCVCANRIIVQEGIYDKFADAFSKAVQSMQVGDGFSEGVMQGPLINEAAVQKVESFVEDAIFKGAKVLLGGKRHSLGMTFYEPTVISDVTEAMLLSREEVFGPVAPLLRFKTEEEAILMANNTKAGLAAYIFTNNVQRSWRVTEALEYGLVGVNEGLISTEVAPFGGLKQSGLGREGSKYGMDEYLEAINSDHNHKVIWIAESVQSRPFESEA
uniref:Succinate-semialdehyde dehydrogenase, mitochondrial n=1 Tax=Salix viminalis TaxID=40686 RepID=A0A6N2NBM8_SALVM